MPYANLDSFGSNGMTPRLESYVFATSVGTATMTVDIVSADGNTLNQLTLDISATPKNFKQLVEAENGVTWTANMVGARITTVVTAAVYWNTSGDTSTNGYAVAPSATISPYIAVGDYRTDPYKVGVCN